MSIQLSSGGSGSGGGSSGGDGESSRIKAAGAVLWRAGSGSDSGSASGSGSAEPEIALIHRDRYDDWSFAKGKAEPGEHALLTAVREVEEETGLRPVLGRRLPTIEYEVLGRPKRVRYWSGRVASGSGAADGADAADSTDAAGHVFVPNDEVDELEWLPAAEARERLTSPLDVHVLDGFLAAPAETFPIILQRHGKAERRGDEYPNDLARPLAAAGRQQAASLAELLAVYGAKDLISSPAVRCVETVRPYAERYDVELQTDSALTEISYIHAPRAIVSWLRQLADRRTGTIVCTHGPLLDELIAAVLYGPAFAPAKDLDGPWLNGQPWSTRVADRWTNDSLSTGCAWVLHLAAGESGAESTTSAKAGSSPRLVAVDRLKP
jgi:phosphohistidine phosphatase SixA/8-oxo-dGTP pyrophosphatase MutT (NUDIX family)